MERNWIKRTNEVEGLFKLYIQHLENSKYQEKSIKKIFYAFEILQEYFCLENAEFFNEEMLFSFYEYTEALDIKKYQINSAKRLAYQLYDYQHQWQITKRVKKRRFSNNTPFSNIGSDFENHLIMNGLKESSASRYFGNFSCFSKYLCGNLSLKEIENLEYADVDKYIKYCIKAEYTNSKLKTTVIFLRKFLTYLFDKKILEENLSLYLPKVSKVEKNIKSSLYSKSEIKEILNAVDRDTKLGKRDYAILTILARLGLRSSDIVHLTFDNLDWENDIIVLNQFKTGRAVQLPITIDVGNSLIDYLKHARSNSNSNFIFLRHVPPFESLKSNSIGNIVSGYIDKSPIELKGRKKGSHIMRHSLATNMLNEGVSLKSISEILGHKSINSTKDYTKLDFERLKKCFVEVPKINNTLYEVIYNV